MIWILRLWPSIPHVVNVRLPAVFPGEEDKGPLRTLDDLAVDEFRHNGCIIFSGLSTLDSTRDAGERCGGGCHEHQLGGELKAVRLTPIDVWHSQRRRRYEK